MKNIFGILNSYHGNYCRSSCNSLWLFLICEKNFENQHHIHSHWLSGFQSNKSNDPDIELNHNPHMTPLKKWLYSHQIYLEARWSLSKHIIMLYDLYVSTFICWIFFYLNNGSHLLLEHSVVCRSGNPPYYYNLKLRVSRLMKNYHKVKHHNNHFPSAD